MQFMLSNGQIVSSPYQFGYLIPDYALALLRIISGQSWIPGVSETQVKEEARVMFRHAAKVLDGQSEVIGTQVRQACSDCGAVALFEYRGTEPGTRQVVCIQHCQCPSEQEAC